MSKKIIIGLSGKMGSGKDTVADMIKATYPNVSIYHFSDNLKQICLDVFRCKYDEVFGQEKEKEFNSPLVVTEDHIYQVHFWLKKSRVIKDFTDNSQKFLDKAMTFLNREIMTPRELMQLLGTEWIRGCYVDSYHIDSVALRIHLSSDDISIIPDIRFFNEKKWLKDIGGYTLVVVGRQRERYDEFSEHPSESEMTDDIDFDYIINNTSSLEVLQSTIISVVKDIVINAEE